MEYEKLYDEFIKLFPEDTYKLQELAEIADAEPSDGMHIMFGMVIIPFVMDLLDNEDKSKIKSAFDFFERMAESDDVLISEVLEFTILEDIISRGKDCLGKCKPFMGIKTLKSCVGVEQYMM